MRRCKKSNKVKRSNDLFLFLWLTSENRGGVKCYQKREENIGMTQKQLALLNGVVGLVGGIFLLFSMFFIVGAASISSSAGNGFIGFGYVLRIAIFVLGIIGLIKIKQLSKAPSVLLVVGGAISIVPLLGWVGGILSIIGGAMYLGTRKSIVEE